jgi:hypothetical protein
LGVAGEHVYLNSVAKELAGLANNIITATSQSTYFAWTG